MSRRPAGHFHLLFRDAHHVIFSVRGGRGAEACIDYAISTGTPVVAAAAGTVAMVAFENDGYGNYVKLSHVDGSKK